MSPLPCSATATTSTESETPDLRALLEQVLTKLSSIDTRLSNLENKSQCLKSCPHWISGTRRTATRRLSSPSLRRTLGRRNGRRSPPPETKGSVQVSPQKQNKPQSMPVVKPMASKALSQHIMDVVTINYYHQFLQAFKVTLLQLQTVRRFCQHNLKKAGVSLDANLIVILLTNLNPHCK